MRILYASERPPYPFFLGGAARCAHEIMHNLVIEGGHECQAVGANDFSNPPWAFPDPAGYEALGILGVKNQGAVGEIDCGYPVRVIADFHGALARTIDDFKPDIVWAQMEGAAFVVDIAREKGVHSLLFVHDAEFDAVELKAISRKVSGIVCSSQFLAAKVKKAIGFDAQVVYPCPQVDFGVSGDENGYLTLINPHRVKGLDTFLEIARALPDEKFLLVESWKLTPDNLNALKVRLENLPNVKFIHRVPDMRQVYRQTRLLLVPSVWEEGFGMVVVEAQSCRIPVVASDRGGLTEAVGDGGVLVQDYQNPAVWVKEIKRFLSDSVYYSTKADLAFSHAHDESLSTEGSANRFIAYCRSVSVSGVGAANTVSGYFKGLKRFLGFR